MMPYRCLLSSTFHSTKVQAPSSPLFIYTTFSTSPSLPAHKDKRQSFVSARLARSELTYYTSQRLKISDTDGLEEWKTSHPSLGKLAETSDIDNLLQDNGLRHSVSIFLEHLAMHECVNIHLTQQDVVVIQRAFYGGHSSRSVCNKDSTPSNASDTEQNGRSGKKYNPAPSLSRHRRQANVALL